MKMNSRGNYSKQPVPETDRRSVLALWNFLVGIFMTLPAFYFASTVIGSLGVVLGSGSILLGLLIAAALASITANIGARTGLSTTNINLCTFGRFGSVPINLVIAIVAVGFYGLTLGFFVDALDQTVQHVWSVDAPLWLYTLFSSAIMTVVVLYGISGMDWLNRVAIPILIVILAAIAVHIIAKGSSISEVVEYSGRPDGQINSFLSGVTASIGMAAAGANAMPDIMRYARRGRDGIVVAMTGLGLTIPIVLILSAVPVAVTGDGNFVGNLLVLGYGVLGAPILIFATFTTNILNCYAGALAVCRVMPKIGDKTATLICAAIGTSLALIGFKEHLLAFFTLIGVFVVPIAGVYIVHYYLHLKRNGLSFDLNTAPAINWRAVISWIVGVSTSFSTQYTDLTMSKISAIDGIVIAGAAYAVLILVVRQKVRPNIGM